MRKANELSLHLPKTSPIRGQHGVSMESPVPGFERGHGRMRELQLGRMESCTEHDPDRNSCIACMDISLQTTLALQRVFLVTAWGPIFSQVILWRLVGTSPERSYNIVVGIKVSIYTL